MENMMTLTTTGQISPVLPQLGERLWIAFAHTMQEFEIRGEQPPDGFLSDAHVPRPTTSTPAEVLAYQHRRGREAGEVFKFGQRIHLEALASRGELRLRAASNYKDPSLNYAVNDDEMNFTVEPESAGIHVFCSTGHVGSVSVSGASFALKYRTDFYIYCMTRRFLPRLFKDFGYDSCLVIYDHDEFVRRLRAAIPPTHQDWLFKISDVIYVDPQNPGGTPLLIPQSKHLRFFYQQEYRIMSEPPYPIAPSLPDLNLRLTPCEDIAEVISTV